MASRFAKPAAQVGSKEWIVKEREVIFGLEQEAIQDFAFAFRNELEWLNEHMAEIFERSRKADMIQLMQTPARLKGRTPMIPRTIKTVERRVNPIVFEEEEEDSESDASPIHAPKALLFQQPPSSPIQISAGVISLSQAAAAIVESSKPAQKEPILPPNSFAASFASNAPTLVSRNGRDSGIWAASQQSQQTLVSSFQDSSKLPAPEESFIATQPDIATEPNTQLLSDDDNTTAGQSFHSANETLLEKSSPPEDTSPMSPKKNVIPASPSKIRSPAKVDVAISAEEPRRSGRLAQRNSIEALPIIKPRTPVRQIASPKPRTPLTNKRNQCNMSPASPKAKPMSPRKSPLKEVITNSKSDSEEDSVQDDPTPITTIVRKSSINFASLPVREPLTSKKKSTGGAHVRASYLEKAAGTAQRTSWMGRAGNGKSLGATSKSIIPSEFDRHEGDRKRSFLAVQDEDVDDERHRKRSRGEQTYSVPTKLGDLSDDETSFQVTEHSKASTRMLHEQIALLSKPNVRQTAHKVVIPVEPSYPQLPRTSESLSKEPAPTLPAENDEDDWIPLSKKTTNASTHTVEPTTVQEAPPTTPKLQKHAFPRSSPKKDNVSIAPQQLPNTAYVSAVKSRPASPSKSMISFEDAASKHKEKALRSSPFKSPVDGAIHGLKTATQNAFKSAKQKLFSSSVLSAGARAEAISPPPALPWKDAPNPPSLDEVLSNGAEKEKASNENPFYPRLPPATPKADKPEPRRTRSSKSREEAVAVVIPERAEERTRQKSPRKEEAERQLEEERRIRECEDAERAKIVAAEEAQRKAEIKKQKAEEKRQEEERRRRQKEELDRERQIRKEQEQAAKERERKEEAKRQDALREQIRKEDEARREEEMQRRERLQEEMAKKLEAERRADDAKRAAAAAKEPSRPISRLAKPASRTLRAPKPPVAQKQPVLIRTASQREMDDRKKLASQSSNSSHHGSMKESGSQHDSQLHSSSSSLHHVPSASSIRAVATTASSAKNLKVLDAAAAARKKQQQEAERKAAQKAESLRRRQENLKKQLEEEQKRLEMQRQRQRTVEREVEMPKKTLKPTPMTKPLDRSTPGPTAGTIRKVEEPVQSSKRPLQELDDPQRYGGSTIKVVQSQPEPKRQRTGEYENRHTEMAPPIRPSVSKKDPMGKLPHGYTSASKISLAHTQLQPKNGPAVHSAQQIPLKSSEPIRSLSDKSRHTESMQMKTPGSKLLKTPVAHKSSPQYPNGDSIELPDIPSDSDEDSDSSLPPGKTFHRPQWAESPELQAQLLQQQSINAEEIFGPMPTLHMEEVFRNSRDRSRFRARSSSANWSGQDRLTQAEIEADLEAQRRMIQQGGWSYGL